jgi:integrase
MANHRRAIKGRTEGFKNVCRFRHPISGKVVRFDLGPDAVWRKNLEELNETFLNPALWLNPPATMPQLIRDQWLGRENKLMIRGETVRKGSKILTVDKKAVARLQLENEALRRRLDEVMARLTLREKELEHWKGKRLHKGPSLTLQTARDKFMSTFTGRSDRGTKNIADILTRFVSHFGPQIQASKLEGRESDINAWLRGLKVVRKDRVARPIGGSRFNFIRIFVLKMLTETAGIVIDRKRIERVSQKTIKRQRGVIRWVTREQAEKIARALNPPWREAWQIQVAIGLRPSELLTLHRKNFNADHSKLTLEPLEHLSLKTGSRTIPVPVGIRPIVEWRLRTAEDGVLFPDPKTGKLWVDPILFCLRYVRRLKQAAMAAGITMPMDARIGRRTCASLLIQDNVSAEKVAALLGNSPPMVLSHYGDPDVEKLDLQKNVVGEVKAS